MSILFLDGCDLYSATGTTSDILMRWDSASGVRTNATTLTGGRFGAGCIDFTTSGSSYVGKTIPTVSALVCGGAYRNGATAATQLLEFRVAAASQFTVNKNASGNIELKRGATVLATSANSMPSSSTDWHWVECKLTVDDAAGACEVRVNGQTWVSVTGVDTKNQATAGVNEVRYMGFGYWDDFYVCDTAGSANSDFLGDCRISTLVPNGDLQAQFARSGGASNAACIDEYPYTGDADYVESSTAGQKDVYSMTDLASNPAVKAVAAVAVARKDDAGTRSVKLGVKHGAVEAQGTDVALITTYRHGMLVRETNPETGAAWTASEVNAASVSIECV